MLFNQVQKQNVTEGGWFSCLITPSYLSQWEWRQLVVVLEERNPVDVVEEDVVAIENWNLV